MRFDELVLKLQSGNDLTREESKRAVFAMMDGSWQPEQTGNFLLLLRSKGESAEELIGFAQAMLEKSVPVRLNGVRVLDTCGTGGDRKGTFNISTVSAFVLAGCGIPVAKHGNRAASSACGSADLLEALGIPFRLAPHHIAPALEQTGFAFLFAPDYHPATKSVAAVRKQLGTPTIFNLLGPLTNPARPAAQLIGVYDRNALPLMEQAIRIMDAQRRAFLIHSLEGHDEATPAAQFMMHSTFSEPDIAHPANYGFDRCRAEDLCGGTPGENARIAVEILEGAPGPKRDTVLLNALLGYMAYYPNASIDDARKAVCESIDSGSALQVLKRCQEISQR